MTIDDVLTLLERFDKSSLTELTLRQDSEEIMLKKGGESIILPSAGGHAHAVHASGMPNPGAPAPAGSEESRSDSEIISSPIVGTFYRAPAPDAPPFVEEGTRLKVGDTLCVIEAMKVMNELEADFDCEIVSVLVENGAMIEYGTPLFEVKRA